MVAMRVGVELPPTRAPPPTATPSPWRQRIIENPTSEQVQATRCAYNPLAAQVEVALTDLFITDGGLAPGPGPAGRSYSAYSVCTPPRPVRQRPAPFRPANWNDPYAHNVDVPEDLGMPATD